MNFSKNNPHMATRGAVPLAEAIEALRNELTKAWYDSQHSTLRFKPSPVELTLQVAVTSAGEGSAGVKWWLIELGGTVSRESMVTQTLKVSLEPRMLDEKTGELLEFLVDAVDPSGPTSEAASSETELDALG